MMRGSTGFYVPSWSPDGKYLVALAQNPARMMLYTAATGAWTKLKDFDMPWGFWIWSHDSQSIYMEATQEKSGIYRLSVPDGKWEKVASLNGVNARQPDAYPSVTADGQVAVMSHTGLAQVYSLTWNH
jgi:Tol biopolymer transport system component